MTDYNPEPGEKLDIDRALKEIAELHASGGPPDFERLANLSLALSTWAHDALDVLDFYADPETYHGVAFYFDAPCGGFDTDFDEEHGHPDYDRLMPGKRARKVLEG